MGQIFTPITGSLAPSAFANPSATVSLAAVNGVSTKAMRSDAAPALDQTISPTWSGFHTFQNNNTLSSPTAGLAIPAAAGNPCYAYERGQIILRTAGAFLRGVAYGSTGTLLAPGGVKNNDGLLAIAGGGFDSAIFATSQCGINLVATEDWGAAARGCNAMIFVTPNGSAASVNVAQFDITGTANDIGLMLYDVTAGTLKRVSRGVADSGGVGFRLLRVAN